MAHQVSLIFEHYDRVSLTRPVGGTVTKSYRHSCLHRQHSFAMSMNISSASSWATCPYRGLRPHEQSQ